MCKFGAGLLRAHNCNLFNVNNTGSACAIPEPEAHDKVLDNNPDRIGIWKCCMVSEERGKPEYPEKNLSKQGREPTTNSTHIRRRDRESNPGHIGGRRVLSPLRHL